MKGVVLAGGTGKRLTPLTKVTNKHLLPVYNKPMIYYPLRTLVRSGIKDITIVLGGESVGDFVKLLGDGEYFGVNLTYVYQKKSGGIAEALALVEHIVEGHKIVVILGDNVFEDTFKKEVEEFERDDLDCCLFLKPVDDPERFGVAYIEDKRIVSIKEKPINPKSDLAVTGMYFYNETIFDVLKTVKKLYGRSKRGEFEISDVNNFYIRNGLLGYKIVDGFWSDAGTFDTLLRSSNFVKHNLAPSF